jgi:hypothetical protein|nr:MAG TPA: hypothetical protein [Caudoviricetes sp.]DAW63327.1 MAG TPA: hypothetical protein [Caudoviricetes sp.]
MTSSYHDLTDKPTLNGVEIVNDKSFEDYGVVPMDANDISHIELEIFGVVLS